jgi:cytochrome c peroxidase
MRRLSIIIIFLVVCFLFSAWYKNKENDPALIVKNWSLTELSQLKLQIDSMLISKGHIDLQKRFYHKARRHFKHVELLLEFYNPGILKYSVNGPPIPKFSRESPKEMIQPKGFQVVEGILFNEKPNKKELVKELSDLKTSINELYHFFEGLDIDKTKLLEISQLELFRITALNLSGYDATVTQTNVKEAFWSLEGIIAVVNAFKKELRKEKDNSINYLNLKKQLALAKAFLLSNTNYSTFNRLKFITDYVDPINALLVRLHNELKFPWTEQSALNLNLGYLFRKQSFNTYFFASEYNDTVHQKLQVEVGRMLFFDPVLSGNNIRSCASCHNPAKGFTDGLAKSRSMDSSVFLTRNAPTLLNVSLQRAFFYDGRVLQLEQQAFDVIHNQKEMGSSLTDAINRLRESREYKNIFSKAFAGTEDSIITPHSVQKAITEYEKTLFSFNSRFDKYLKGNKKMLTKEEINGFNLFSGKALCGSCHFFPVFNGTVPPYYNDSEFEVIGVPATPDNKSIDEDLGRYNLVQLEDLKFSFKTPTVRNIALTAPYMHNGVYKDLNQVMEFYHKGGGAGFGFKVPNQTLPFDSLQLSPKEKQDIIKFLKSLTDTSGLTQRPARLPRFENNEALNKRKIGGVY